MSGRVAVTACYSSFGGSGLQFAITNSGAVAEPTCSLTRKRFPFTTSYSAPSGSRNKVTGLPKRRCLRSTTGTATMCQSLVR